MPWVLGGDFNEIIYLSEKSGGLNTCSSSMRNFGETLNNCALIDIGYKDSPFTWTNNQLFPCSINVRLDRFLENINWKYLFREARAIHLDYYGSDHRMILIELTYPYMFNTSNYPGMKPFRFEPFWQKDPMFK